MTPASLCYNVTVADKMWLVKAIDDVVTYLQPESRGTTSEEMKKSEDVLKASMTKGTA